jgi:hypothetical protein
VASGRGQRLEHTAPVRAVAFRRGRSRLATAAADGAVRLWDTATARELSMQGVSGEPLEALFESGGALFGADAHRLFSIAPPAETHTPLESLTTAVLLDAPKDLLATPTR